MTTPHTHPSAAERRARAKDALGAAVLLGLGVYFVALLVTGNLTHYINLRFAWLTVLAAALFFLLGAARLLGLMRPSNGGHGHTHVLTWGAVALLAAPLLLGVGVPSEPLGAEAVSGSLGAAPVGVVSDLTFAVAPEQRTVLDWLRAFSAAPDLTALTGLPADVIGFVYIEPNTPPDEFMAARFTIACCVADASAIGLPVRWAAASELAQGAWVQVRGQIEVETVDGELRPVLRAETVEIVPQPEHPYLYP
jgi:uncharacterized repeat protein (TIGR03943 family)